MNLCVLSGMHGFLSEAQLHGGPSTGRRMPTARLAPLLVLTVVALIAPAASAASDGVTAAAAAPAAAAPAASGAAATVVNVAAISKRTASSASADRGYSPAALRSAYNLVKPAVTGGSGETVAIVTAYSDPDAAADLAKYRSHYGLPACGSAHGCLRIVNEQGKTGGLPKPNSSWALGDAVELDVVSALCQRCRLLLVEASAAAPADLGIAEDSAVALGARFVLDGWSEPEGVGQDAYDHYFYHPGVAVVAAAGDGGYGTTYPGDLAYVTSVGGTTLTRTRYNTRGWAETVWADTGSGCSALEPKPGWQRADANPTTGCLTRTQNDVAADADPATGASVFDSYETKADWAQAGGTAVAAAIVTAAYALAGTPARDSYPASYPYQHSGHLYDVTFGSNGTCLLHPAYTCNAEKGYDAPSGLGTPDGDAAFTASGTAPVEVLNPGTQDDEAGTNVAVQITGLDTRAGASLSYAATGLPAGLTIEPVPHSTNAEISGALPTSDVSYTVTVTAKDAKTGATASTKFAIVAAGSLTPTSPVTTSIGVDAEFVTEPNNCLDSGAGTAGTTVTIQACTGTAEQLWTYLPEGTPGAGYELTINGLCLGLANGTVDLAACDRAVATQTWRLLDGWLENTGTGTCLQPGVQSGAGLTNPLTLQTCVSSLGLQQWDVLRATVQSGVPGMCMATEYGTPGQLPLALMVEPCGQSGEDYGYTFGADGQLLTSGGDCIGVSREGIDITSGCSGTPDTWIPLPDGQLYNVGYGVCLDDPGGSTTAGTQLDVAPCNGSLGEIWAIA